MSRAGQGRAEQSRGEPRGESQDDGCDSSDGRLEGSPRRLDDERSCARGTMQGAVQGRMSRHEARGTENGEGERGGVSGALARRLWLGDGR